MARRNKALQQNGGKNRKHRDHRSKKGQNSHNQSDNEAFFMFKSKKNEQSDDLCTKNLIFLNNHFKI